MSEMKEENALNYPGQILSRHPWRHTQEKILAKTQIACLLANMNNVQMKPPAPVELIWVELGLVGRG